MNLMKNITVRVITALLLIFGTLFATPIISSSVYADEPDLPTLELDTPSLTENFINNLIPADNPEEGTFITDDPITTDSDTTDDTTTTDDASTEETTDTCRDAAGNLYWLICPGPEFMAGLADNMYNGIVDLSKVEPISNDADSPIYTVWQYARNITNIVFIIFLVIVIYSQLTGLGITNYGIKRTLPRLIIAIILVNLSFIICSLVVDISNILGSAIYDLFNSIQESISANGVPDTDANLGEILTVVIGGGTLAGIALEVTGTNPFFFLIPILIGAVVAVIAGFLTIAARQALVTILIMIAPLALLAYLLPNTEKWFSQWKNLLFRMLVFYPAFSLLFGASQLAGWAVTVSASNAYGVFLGIAIRFFPLIFSFSLMKMSGTILNSINTGFRRLADPIQRGITGWSLSHQEVRRQKHLANSYMPGAKLRQFLDYRRDLRELDTKNALTIRQSRARERALITASSSTGADRIGNDTWREYANNHTALAKTAAVYETRAANAQLAHKNTLSAYGRHFSGYNASYLGDMHADAYLDSMKQQFLTANEAQNDQDWLLDQYMQATADSETNPYNYNRLVNGAAGSLGHLGVASIMGQVIVGNANIEARRRTEARIIINKFGIKKPLFRAMVYDKAGMNDNGYALNKNGEIVENDQYRLLPGKEYDEWDDYIWVDKKDRSKNISKEAYAALSESERDQYKRIRYMNIKDDKDNVVAVAYEDDAGFMKELLTDDINIGDPINRRYLTSIGLAYGQGESDGILRRYHSTITAAMLTSKYKEHAAEVTPMITAQTNMGYVTTAGQYNIANLQSLAVASKAGMILQNDAYAIETWSKLIASTDQELFEKLFPNDVKNHVNEKGEKISAFEYYFPNQDIDNYLNVNGQHLGGMLPILDDAGNIINWEEIDDPNDSRVNTETRKNLLRNKILPKAAAKLVGSLNRRISPGVLDNQKPDTLKALKILSEQVLNAVGLKNMDPNIPFAEKLGGSKNIYDSDDPNILIRSITETQQQIEQILATQKTGSTNSLSQPRTYPQHSHPSVQKLQDQLFRQQEADAFYRQQNSYTEIVQRLDGIFNSGFAIEVLASELRELFSETPCLQPFLAECSNLINQFTAQTTGLQPDQELLDNLYDDIMQLVYRAETY